MKEGESGKEVRNGGKRKKRQRRKRGKEGRLEGGCLADKEIGS